MTVRSVAGVKAPAGKFGFELSAGVVTGLLVVRSVLSKQVASASWWPSAASSRGHLCFAGAASTAADESAATQHASWMRI